MDDIKNLSIDEKLNILLDNMFQLNVKLRTDNIEKYVYFNCATHEVVDQRLRLLEYKQIDIEARQRECNLLVSGLQEIVGENSIDIVSEIFTNKLKLHGDSFRITRAQRIGRMNTTQHNSADPEVSHVTRHRPILVTLAHPSEVYAILGKAKELKGTSIGLSKDFPREIAEARRTLWPEFKRLRGVHGATKVKMVYPAAISVNGKIVENLFPEWHSVMSQSRVTDVSDRIINTLKSKQDDIRRCFDNIMSAPPSVAASPRRATHSNMEYSSQFETTSEHSSQFETTSESDMNTDDEIRKIRQLTAHKTTKTHSSSLPPHRHTTGKAAATKKGKPTPKLKHTATKRPDTNQPSVPSAMRQPLETGDGSSTNYQLPASGEKGNA